MKTVAFARRWPWAALALFMLVTAGTVRAGSAVPAEDDGYFLSMRQKGQLIWRGRIQDSVGRWYDVWICPGYTPPTTYGWEHIRKGGKHFHRYVEARKYSRLTEQSGDCFEWAFEDCAQGFVVKGVPKAWGRYLDKAAERTERRVFGSIVAYPWAVMEGVFDTSFRVAGGLCGVVLGTAAGVAVVPAWHALNSGVAGTAVFVGQGLVLPASGYAWNTVISPTLAMVGGPRPAPSRADGFWVRLVDDKGRGRSGLTPEELSAAVAWGVLMLTEVQPGLDRSQALAAETEQKITALRQEMAREQQRLRAEADQRAAQFRDASGHPPAAAALLSRYAEQIEQALRQDGTLSAADVQKIMELVRRYPPPLPPPGPAAPEKTDPLRRGAEILQDLPR